MDQEEFKIMALVALGSMVILGLLLAGWYLLKGGF